MRIGTIALTVWLAAACGHGAEDRARRTRQLATCVDAIDRAPRLGPDARLVALARGCAPACPGLGRWADATDGSATAPRSWRRDWVAGATPASAPDAASTALLDGCAPACGGVAPAGRERNPWPAVVSRCGPGALGLGKDRGYLASADWWILSRIATWLDGNRNLPVDDVQLPVQLERATLRAWFGLPLPARDIKGRYTLPSSRLGRPSDARLYVIVNATQIRAGAVPRVHLRGPDLDVRTGPGGDFPGQQVDEGQLRQVFAEDVAMVDGAAGRAPLLLVDEYTTVARLAAIFADLGVEHAELAVAGATAQAHPVLLERASPETAAAPILLVHADAGPGALAIQGYGDDRVTTWDGLDDELDHFAAVNAPVRRLALATDVPVTAVRLVAILDACARARVASVVMPSP